MEPKCHCAKPKPAKQKYELGELEGARHGDPEQNTNVALHRTIIEDRKRSHKKRKLQNN